MIGVPDARWGETVKAVVVRRKGTSLNGEELIAWTRDKLASYKRPRSVDFNRCAAAQRQPASCSSASCASRTGKATRAG